MSTIDLGNGQSVARHHIVKHALAQFDEATAALDQIRTNIRAWVRPLYAMQAPASFSGSMLCNGLNQSGRTYDLNEVGGAMLVDQRDVPFFRDDHGFTMVPSGAAPTTEQRVGLVFFDESVNGHMRWNGSAWAPVTLT